MSSPQSSAKIRVPLKPWWWAAFVLVPVVIGLASAFLTRSSVESNLQSRVERGVLSSGVSPVTVVVDGQDVTAKVPVTSSDAALQAVRSAVGKVDGVRSVKVQR